VGNGTQIMTRFYFDVANASCQKFEFSGDGGNENNFPTELDCLNDCYIDVHEGEPVKEEDITLIGRSTDRLLVAKEDCLLPKESGNCSAQIESFYFSPEWQSCLAFKYTGCGGNSNRFASRIECEQNCLIADGSVCKGPHSSITPEQNAANCAETKCPDGFICAMGLRVPECCNETEHSIIRDAYSQQCSDGSQAGGHFGEYFVATFASSCADLSCSPNEKCEHDQATGGFAKCCLKEAKNDGVTKPRRNNAHKNDVKQSLPLAN